jgi:hypothetical protein
MLSEKAMAKLLEERRVMTKPNPLTAMTPEQHKAAVAERDRPLTDVKWAKSRGVGNLSVEPIISAQLRSPNRKARDLRAKDSGKNV